MLKHLSLKRLLAFFVLGGGLTAVALLIYTQTQRPQDRPRASAQATPAAPQEARADWQIGQLRPNGLRIKPSGRTDAANVLDPSRFTRPEVQRTYQIATKIPEVLNQLYCWCGCENRGVHRSNLGCFEDEMAVDCAVCRGTAEIAFRMTKDGITDAGSIQAAVDKEWGPVWARKERERPRE